MRQEIKEIIQDYLERANKLGLKGIDFELYSGELNSLMYGIVADIKKILQKERNDNEKKA